MAEPNPFSFPSFETKYTTKKDRIAQSVDEFIKFTQETIPGKESEMIIRSIGTDSILEIMHLAKLEDGIGRYSVCEYFELCEENEDSGIYSTEYNGKTYISDNITGYIQPEEVVRCIQAFINHYDNYED
jgi:hypothetical protein